jgi:multiple sugar transport system substrate-binding protein
MAARGARFCVLIVLLIGTICLGIPTHKAAAGELTFFGKTAEDLFPDSAFPPGSPDVIQGARANAFKLLLAANIPDGHALGQGKTITVATLGQGATGGISGTAYFWRPAFEAATGTKMEIVEIPFNQLQTVIPTDFLTGQNTYDVIVTAAWFYGDYISNGWIQPIDKYVEDPRFPQWNPKATLPSIQKMYVWDGKQYGTQMDADAQLLYYRRDVLSDPEWQAAYKQATGDDLPNPPRTWQQLLEVTSFFNGKDYNGNGKPGDGISLHLKVGGQGMFHFIALSAPFSITPNPAGDPAKVTQYHNLYWFDPNTLAPLINQPGQVAALEFLQKLAATGQRSQFGWELSEAWQNFFDGNAIATFSWGDVGSLSQSLEKSRIKGKLGAAPIPCSDTWYDMEQKKMITDPTHPNCVGNTVGASWHPVLSAFTREPELSYFFMAMLATPPINFFNETTGWQGIDPCCDYSFFKPLGRATIDDYTVMGFDAGDFTGYIPAYGANLTQFPIYQTYLRIPGTPAYLTALDTRLSEAMTGQKSAQQALDDAATDWNKITVDADGPAKLLKVYQDSIGYVPNP